MKKCKCEKKCKCMDHKSKKPLIFGQLKNAIKELVKQAMEEMHDESIEEVSTGGGAGAFSSPYAFGNRGKKIATAGLPGYKTVGGVDETKKKSKEKTTIVPVGKEKTPDVVKGPKSRGIKKDDVYILRKRKAIAASKKDEKDVEHYDSLISLAKKAGIQ